MGCIEKIRVKRAPGKNRSCGLLMAGHHTWHCKLGKSGISTRKFEGDYKTPAGVYRLMFGFYRKDRVRTPISKLPFTPVRMNDGWCDDPNSSRYNRRIIRPFPGSHETLARTDSLYDVIIVMDHNYTSRIRNRGSAVFMHLDAGKPHTAGCIAIELKFMKQLLPLLGSRTRIEIFP